MSNLIINSGFENGLATWTSTNVDWFYDNYASSYTAKILIGGIIQQTVQLKELTQYRLTFKARSWQEGANNLNVSVGGTNRVIPVTVTTPYATYTDIFKTTTGTGQWLEFSTPNVPGNTIFIDDVLLEEIATTNIVQNAGFEQGLTFWSVLSGIVTPLWDSAAASEALKIESGSIKQTINSQQGTHTLILNFRAWYTMLITVTVGTVSKSYTPITTGYQTITDTFVTTGTDASITISSGTNVIFVNYVSLTTTTSPPPPQTYTVAANVNNGIGGKIRVNNDPSTDATNISISVPSGTSYQLEAIPTTNYEFDKWINQNGITYTSSVIHGSPDANVIYTLYFRQTYTQCLEPTFTFSISEV
jgi:hypothetical protein